MTLQLCPKDGLLTQPLVQMRDGGHCPICGQLVAPAKGVTPPHLQPSVMALTAAKFEMLPHLAAVKDVFAKYWKTIGREQGFGLMAQVVLDLMAPAFGQKEEYIPTTMREMANAYEQILKNGGHLVRRGGPSIQPRRV